MQVKIRKLGAVLLDILYPPSCILCGADVAQQGAACVSCFDRLQSISRPFCDACAAPQPSQESLGHTGLCAACEQHHPAWQHARAAFVYTAAARDLILQLKYADRTENARFLAQRMMQIGQDILRPDVLLVPVPVHRWRLLRRRYNQAALLAAEVARVKHLQVLPDALMRTRATTKLAGFSRKERQQEMQSAITFRPKWQQKLHGRSVVLVDDMLTTGATATACVQALRQAGVLDVSLLVAGLVPARPEVDINLPE
ncbi:MULTISPECIES: ComF family protein [Acetobacter]|uniref:Competence protein F n=1 Tax=Acetobacter pomorum DM001 TaxID=945681 RepID=F1YQI5_9PROT|nr:MULTISPECIES: ComF family protein [Acetobacter]ATI11306.1 amidophosphoribosyltransferase [Acetobacter pomorum]AXC26355.1 ComF family protein [Acetobacter sp. JWB]EGE48870.1 Competence protein F [Acetobacter pomorum DM001]KAA8428088.1 ComF family protein [Acetobacter pomorum]KAA8437119.1 ComF family protein [Acetobacter pomorum]